MAVMDLYNSLSDDQKAHILACRTVTEALVYAEKENIALTEDHLEAIYGIMHFGKKEERAERIETGLYGRFMVPSEEWSELIQEARENEQAIRRRFPSADEQESAALRLIVGENRTFADALYSAEDFREFFDFCLTLRGSCREAQERRLAREQVRLLGYLKDNAPLPDSPEGFLQLWETANQLEPRWYDDLPAHFRTPQDRIPFGHEKNRVKPGPVPQGGDTSLAEEIPEAVSRLVEWVQRYDMETEMHALIAHHLLVRIHPFPDGNGHTARMLCCGLLAPYYSAVTLTAFLGQMKANKRYLSACIKSTELLEGYLCHECCTMIRFLIRGQKQALYK